MFTRHENHYAAAYDALTNGYEYVEYNPDDDTWRRTSAPTDRALSRRVELDAYLPLGELSELTEAEFVAMCEKLFGPVEPPVAS